jgi:hypothetical protein
VDGTGKLWSITNDERAPLEFEDVEGDGDGVLACFSGKYNDVSLNVESSDSSCATGVYDTPIPLGESDLAAIKDGYLKSVELLDMVTALWVAAVDLRMNP